MCHKYVGVFNGKQVADEILQENPVPDIHGRPTAFTDFHGYARSYENKTLNMQVINMRPKDNFEAVFEKYDEYRSVFEILALPNVGKLLKYLYTDTSPEDCTLKYLSEQTEVDEETIEKIVSRMSIIREAVIDGEKVKTYLILPCDEIFSLICTAYGHSVDWGGAFMDNGPSADMDGKRAVGRIIKGG